MREDVITIITNSLVDINKTKLSFADYLSSGSKDIWDDHVITNSFVMGLANIHDKKVLSKENNRLIETILKDLQPASYVSDNREWQKSYLESFIIAEGQIAQLVKDALTQDEISRRGKEDLEFYDLWHKLIESV